MLLISFHNAINKFFHNIDAGSVLMSHHSAKLIHLFYFSETKAQLRTWDKKHLKKFFTESYNFKLLIFWLVWKDLISCFVWYLGMCLSFF